MSLIELDSTLAGPGASPGQPDSSRALRSAISYSLFRSRWTMALLALIGLLLGFLYGAVRPNLYESSGKLMVRPGVRESATPEAAIGIEHNSRSGIQEAVATELIILNNPILAERVAARLGIARILTSPDPAAGDDESTPLPVRLLHQFQSWLFGAGAKPGSDFERATVAAAIVRGGVSLNATRQSSVIEVVCRSSKPKLARDVVDAFLDVADAFHREIFPADTGYSLLKDREKTALHECDAANQSLARFVLKHDLYDFNTQKAGLIAEIRALTERVAHDEIQAEILQARLEYLDAQLKLLERDAVEIRVINPTSARLQTELSEMQRSRREAITRTGETAGDFKKRLELIDAWIKGVEAELAQHPKYVVQPDARKAQLLARCDEAREQLVGIIATQTKQKERLERLRGDLRGLRQIEPENNNLVLQAEQCRLRIEQSSKSLEQVGLMSLLDAEKLGNLRILERPILPQDKISPSRTKYLGFGAIMGLLAGAVLAFMRTATDSRITRASELAEQSRSPILGVVPELRISRSKAEGAIMRGLEGRSPFQELIDSLWSRILPANKPVGQMKIAFVSTDADQGCSSVAAAAGLGLALRTRQPVILIETGFESPGLARCFGLDEAPGLSEVLAGEVDLGDAIQETGVPGLSVLCAGNGPRPEPGAFSTEATGKVLQRAIECSQYAVFDLAPLREDPDSRVLLWEVDAVVAVVRSRRVRKDVLRTLSRTVQARGANLIGCVLNRYRSVRPFWLPGPDPELQES